MGYPDIHARVLVPVRQRPSSRDLNYMQWLQQASDLAAAGTAYGTNYASSPTTAERDYGLGAIGFSGAGLRVETDPTSLPWGVRLVPGYGYNNAGPVPATDIDSAQGADWSGSSQWGIPILLGTYQAFTVPGAPVAGSSRIDIIEVRADYLATDPATVGIFNPGTETFNPTVVNKNLTWDLAGRTGTVNAPNPSTAPISYVVGQSAVGDITAATAPTVTPGYLQLCRINLDKLGGALAGVTDGMIADMRKMLFPQGMLRVGGVATIPGVAAGFGSEIFNSVELSPSLLVKMLYQNNVPPAAGTSYNADFYVIGGDLRPRTLPGSRGAVTANSTSLSPRICQVYLTETGLITPAIASMLAGTDPNWTVVNGAAVFAVGQPYARFVLRVLHPTGAALSNTEQFHFNYLLNMG